MGFTGPKVNPVQYQEENTDHKPCPLVAIDKRMIANDARRVQRRHFDDAGGVGTGVVLSWPGKSRFQQARIAKSDRASMKRQMSVVDREHIAGVDPKRVVTFTFTFTSP